MREVALGLGFLAITVKDASLDLQQIYEARMTLLEYALLGGGAAAYAFVWWLAGRRNKSTELHQSETTWVDTNGDH